VVRSWRPARRGLGVRASLHPACGRWLGTEEVEDAEGAAKHLRQPREQGLSRFGMALL
jgi:hypothetical protein